MAHGGHRGTSPQALGPGAMTRLLASVTGPDEARIARSAGADIVDMKDPAAGALGALPLARIRLCVEALGGHPSSATVGDLPPDPGLVADAVAATAATGVKYVKVGLFDNRAYGACIEALARETTGGLRLIAVLFADLDPDPTSLPALAAAGFTGVMLDTAHKAQGGLRSHMDTEQIGRFVAQARTLGLLCGLAGSLRMEDIPALLVLQPDYLGFRTALCQRRRRDGHIDPDAVCAIRETLDRSCTPSR
jgi:uncharacterized protein (UPF0264 family)